MECITRSNTSGAATSRSRSVVFGLNSGKSMQFSHAIRRWTSPRLSATRDRRGETVLVSYVRASAADATGTDRDTGVRSRPTTLAHGSVGSGASRADSDDTGGQARPKGLTGTRIRFGCSRVPRAGHRHRARRGRLVRRGSGCRPGEHYRQLLRPGRVLPGGHPNRQRTALSFPTENPASVDVPRPDTRWNRSTPRHADSRRRYGRASRRGCSTADERDWATAVLCATPGIGLSWGYARLGAVSARGQTRVRTSAPRSQRRR